MKDFNYNEDSQIDIYEFKAIMFNMSIRKYDDEIKETVSKNVDLPEKAVKSSARNFFTTKTSTNSSSESEGYKPSPTSKKKKSVKARRTLRSEAQNYTVKSEVISDNLLFLDKAPGIFILT